MCACTAPITDEGPQGLWSSFLGHSVERHVALVVAVVRQGRAAYLLGNRREKSGTQELRTTVVLGKIPPPSPESWRTRRIGSALGSLFLHGRADLSAGARPVHEEGLDWRSGANGPPAAC